jgi:hypothetical protein
MAAKRTNARLIPGMAAPGSKPAGSAKQLRQGITSTTLKPGPNMHRQTQQTDAGGGVTVNSQPVNGG